MVYGLILFISQFSPWIQFLLFMFPCTDTATQLQFTSDWCPIVSSSPKYKKAIPVGARRVPGGLGSQISRQWADECNQVARPTHRSLFLLRNCCWYSFLLEAVCSSALGLVRPEGLCQWKIPVTPSGIETATFRLVTQCLNQLATACLLNFLSMYFYTISVTDT